MHFYHIKLVFRSGANLGVGEFIFYSIKDLNQTHSSKKILKVSGIPLTTSPNFQHTYTLHHRHFPINNFSYFHIFRTIAFTNVTYFQTKCHN